MLKITLISPVYNSADHIIGCIDSLLAQTMADGVEVIFVDDHGQDNSIELAKNYLVGKVTAIKFVFAATEKNSGPGGARNRGLELAEGEYVGFVDSDDAIEPTFCEKLYSAALLNSADIACCNLKKQSADGLATIEINGGIPCGELDDEEKKRFFASYVSFFTTFIYRIQFLKETRLSFLPLRSSEDSCFLASALLAARRSAVVPEPLYIYLIREGSVTTSCNTSRYNDKLAAFDSLLSYARGNGYYTRFQDEIDFIYMKKGYLVSVFNYIANGGKDLGVISHIRKHFEASVPQYETCRYLKGKFWALATMLKYTPHIAVKVIARYVRNSDMMF